MKLFIYSHLGKDGKPQYQKIEISDSEADEWVQVDFEKRRKADPTAVKRTAQEIQDSIDREFLNSDRREFSHRAKHNTVKNDEGREIEIVETIADKAWTPEQQAIYADYIRIIREGMREIYADIFICVGLEQEPLAAYANRKGIKYTVAKERLSRAREMARKLF